jgi:alpha-mannosidase
MTNALALVDAWKATYPDTALVLADPQTAFHYIATQPIPEVTVDLNPVWQGFYGSRPFAKVADKESEYFLTAADKFGVLTDAPPSAAWLTATVNAHYDNISGVSFDNVWETSQRPRYTATLDTAAHDLANTVAHIASAVDAPLMIFNPTSWARTEIIEVADANIVAPWPHQTLPDGSAAVRVANVPAMGYAAFTSSPIRQAAVAITSSAGVILSNGLVTVTLDAAQGGTFSSLLTAKAELIHGIGDNLTYWEDTGDVYGAHFGQRLVQASDTPAQIELLATGPLLARAQVTLLLGGQAVTKTVTVRADSPLVEVALTLKALPETSAVVHTSTTLSVTERTDDLGFAAFTHPFDGHAIQAGDMTYRRRVFYPTLSWTDVADADKGLTLMTHGLPGVGGVNDLSLLLVRSVTEEEGLSDLDYHTLYYAYAPHSGAATEMWSLAYAFNQPLIPVWRTGDLVNVQLPFRETLMTMPTPVVSFTMPLTRSLLAAQSGLIADVYRVDAQLHALVIDYDPTTPVTLFNGASLITMTALGPVSVPVTVTK